MSFIEELRWRGMLHNITPDVEAALEEGMMTGYIGFDPTAPSLTIGNYVQIMLLKLFQDAGHKPIVLMGGATGRIGDPSGKDKERTLKSYKELDHNLAHQQAQFARFLNFESGDNKAEVVNNYDFYKNMNVLDFLRDVGKTMTINVMMKKDSVKNRLETGLSFTEFSYQLLQGYDFQKLYETKGCKLQMGGSDQWGNIVAGTEFIRKNLGQSAFAVTTPLLTKADGSKFGKSEAGNIWLDPKLTSPYKFYQFWINADDRDLPKFMRYFTLKSKAEVEALEAEYANNPQALKRILAEELTVRVHGQDAYESVLKVTEILFNRKASAATLQSLSADDLAIVAEEIPSFKVDESTFTTAVNIVDLLSEHTQILASKSEVKRAIKGNAIAVNKQKVGSDEATVAATELLHDKYLMVENGKKNKFIVVVA